MAASVDNRVPPSEGFDLARAWVFPGNGVRDAEDHEGLYANG
jgi:hypothetical protein